MGIVKILNILFLVINKFGDCQVLSVDLLFSFQPFFLWNMKLNNLCLVLNIFLIYLFKGLPK